MNPDDHLSSIPAATDPDARLRQHVVDTFSLVAAAPAPATAALGLQSLAQVLASRVWERPRLDSAGVLHAPTTFLSFVRSLAPANVAEATGVLDRDLAGLEWVGGVVRDLAALAAVGAPPASRQIYGGWVVSMLHAIKTEAAAEAPHVGALYAAISRTPADAIAATVRH